MNTGRTTSFFGCFLVGILMSKNNYDKIDVFLGSFLVVSDEKVRESIFFGFIMAVRLKNINFYILISVNILYQNNELSTSVKYIFYAIFTISCFFVINPCNSSIKCMFCISWKWILFLCQFYSFDLLVRSKIILSLLLS